MTAMRIAMVSEHASPLAGPGGVDAGGQNVHVAALATELGRLGCEVVVHTRRDAPSLPRRAPFAPGVTVEHVDAGPPRPVAKDQLLPHMDDFAADLERSWDRARPHVVHAHFWMSGRASLGAAGRAGIPVVQTFHALGVVKRRHQGPADTSPPERIEEERAIAAKADRLVATCSDEVFELVRMGADLERVRVVPCGVHADMFRPDGPVEDRPRPGQRLVAVGRLVPRKGLDTAVRALAQLPGAELVVAGGPDRAELAQEPEAQRLRALAAELGVGDRLDLRGRVARRDVPALLRSADVAVCVPWYEPFGMVAVEAMACGIPVVASAVGGHTDTVIDGVTGIHVAPRDPDGLAEALGGLLADERRRRSLGQAGARRVRDRYTWRRVAGATLDAYRQLVATPARGEAGRVGQSG